MNFADARSFYFGQVDRFDVERYIDNPHRQQTELERQVYDRLPILSEIDPRAIWLSFRVACAYATGHVDYAVFIHAADETTATALKLAMR